MSRRNSQQQPNLNDPLKGWVSESWTAQQGPERRPSYKLMKTPVRPTNGASPNEPSPIGNPVLNPFSSPQTGRPPRSPPISRPGSPSETVGSHDGSTVGKVIIGKGITLSGDILECEYVVIAGTYFGIVEANVVVLEVGCTFKGAIVAEKLTIAGCIDATSVVCTQHLHLRSTCKGAVDVLEYNTMDMEPCARITGKIIHRPNMTFSNIVKLKNSGTT